MNDETFSNGDAWNFAADKTVCISVAMLAKALGVNNLTLDSFRISSETDEMLEKLLILLVADKILDISFIAPVAGEILDNSLRILLCIFATLNNLSIYNHLLTR